MVHDQQLMDASNKLLPKLEELTLTFSKRWIERLKKWYGYAFTENMVRH